MSLTNDVIAVWAFALVGPAVLFVTALFLRQIPPAHREPARSADRIVSWFAAHPQLSLWVLLLMLPFGAFVLGSVALLRTWADNPQLQYYTWRALAEIPEHWPAMSIGGATFLAAAVLVTMTAHLFSASQNRRRA
jgi:hypothetical protein